MDFDWLDGRPVFISMSGGKDSTATALYLRENKVDFTPVFMDTGWEHEITYSYIKDVLEPLFGKFIVLRNQKFFDPDVKDLAGGMEQMVFSANAFPSGAARSCTYNLKILPFRSFMSEQRLHHKKKPVAVVGLRAEESSSRSKLSVVDEKDESTIFRPIIGWKEHQVIGIHQRHGVPPNPLYLRGNDRVGCYPCILSGKQQIRHLAMTDPDRIRHIQRMEDSLVERESPYPHFFSFKLTDRLGNYIKSSKIIDVVRWAYIDGLTLEPVDDLEKIEDTGCMRWGLCEHPKAQSDARKKIPVNQPKLDIFRN